jgi:hypothetical protein
MALCKGKPPKGDTGLNSHKKYRVKKFYFQAIIAKYLMENGYLILGIRYWTNGRDVKLPGSADLKPHRDRESRFDITIYVHYVSLTD